MRLIDADSLIVAFEPDHDCDWYTPWIIEKINEAPTVDAVPVVRAKWIPQNDIFTKFMCSRCEEIDYNVGGNFCPYCGADMRGEK
jgi:hypothetical protein